MAQSTARFIVIHFVQIDVHRCLAPDRVTLRNVVTINLLIASLLNMFFKGKGGGGTERASVAVQKK